MLWAIDGMATESVRDGMNAQAEALREAELLRERAVGASGDRDRRAPGGSHTST